jgi:hypothetical protein
MKITIASIVFLFATSMVSADDPGERDSLIIETVYAELGDTAVDVRIFVTCDDSVGYYNMPLSWNQLGDSSMAIYPSDVSYFYPITGWDHVWDSVLFAEQFIRMVGITNGGEPDPPLITDNNRLNCWILHFAVDSVTYPHIVLIDSTFDLMNGSLLFGLFGGVQSLVPVFTPGAIFYGITSDTESDGILPEDYYLLQNYPNPFNASATIEFTLPEESEIEISVYNILGQKVAVLFEGVKPPGQHTATWQAGDAPSGVYFARLEGAGKSRAVKMLLLR